MVCVCGGVMARKGRPCWISCWTSVISVKRCLLHGSPLLAVNVLAMDVLAMDVLAMDAHAHAHGHGHVHVHVHVTCYMLHVHVHVHVTCYMCMHMDMHNMCMHMCMYFPCMGRTFIGKPTSL